MTILRAMVISATATLLGACATQPNLMPSAEFAPVQPAPVAPATAATGAIFNNGMGLFGDLRSYQGGDLKVGDLITVLLSETTQASAAAIFLLAVRQQTMLSLNRKKTLSYLRSVAAPDSLAILN